MGPISGLGKSVDEAMAALFEAKYEREEMESKRIDLLERRVKSNEDFISKILKVLSGKDDGTEIKSEHN